MRTWTRHVDAIDHIRWFVDKSPDNGKSILNLLTEVLCFVFEYMTVANVVWYTSIIQYVLLCVYI
jgi:hypothetical protein